MSSTPNPPAFGTVALLVNPSDEGRAFLARTGIKIIDENQPLVARVVSNPASGLANVVVDDHLGYAHPVQNVPFFDASKGWDGQACAWAYGSATAGEKLESLADRVAVIESRFPGGQPAPLPAGDPIAAEIERQAEAPTADVEPGGSD